jgi:hypothetical protein
MAWSVSGGFAAAAANQILNCWAVFNSPVFVGPIAVAPNFAGGNENFGQLTTGDIAVQAVEGNPNEPNAYYPVSFTYLYSTTNDNPRPLVHNVMIGTF